MPRIYPEDLFLKQWGHALSWVMIALCQNAELSLKGFLLKHIVKRQSLQLKVLCGQINNLNTLWFPVV